MKIIAAAALLVLPLFMAACAHPLESIVDQNHQARIDAANANQPLARGAADGLGTYIAVSHDAENVDVKAQH